MVAVDDPRTSGSLKGGSLSTSCGGWRERRRPVWRRPRRGWARDDGACAGPQVRGADGVRGWYGSRASRGSGDQSWCRSSMRARWSTRATVEVVSGGAPARGISPGTSPASPRAGAYRYGRPLPLRSRFDVSFMVLDGHQLVRPRTAPSSIVVTRHGHAQSPEVAAPGAPSPGSSGMASSTWKATRQLWAGTGVAHPSHGTAVNIHAHYYTVGTYARGRGDRCARPLHVVGISWRSAQMVADTIPGR
jgi:hypothetical protein